MTAPAYIPSTQIRSGGWAWPVVAAFTFLLCLCFFVPWRPNFIRTSALDDSWMLALHVAFANHFQFGRDIVFTFGPWGFLNTRCYYPDTYPLMLTAWIFFAAVFWRVAWLIAVEHISNPAIALLWLIAIPGIAAMNLFSQSATLLSLISLLAVFYFYCDSRTFPWTSSLLIAAIALASLIKFTYFIGAVLTVSAISIDQIRHRKLPAAIMLFCAFFITFFLLAGQSIASLGDYLRLSSRVASGYTDGMSFSTGQQNLGPIENTPPPDLLLFFLAGTLLIGATLAAKWKQKDWILRLLAPAVIAGVIFTFGKWGYVRHDLVHITLAALALLFLTFLALPALRSHLPGRRWRVRLGLVGAAAIISSWTVVRAGTGQNLPVYFVQSMIFELRLDVIAAKDALTGHSTNDAEYQSALADIRNFAPLPVVHGSVDIYPWNQAIAAAYELPYHPRPVFQSYSAYSPDLANLNAQFLESSRSPDTIIFAVTHEKCGLQHLPAFDDGFSWPQLLSRYDIRGRSGTFLLLTKSAHPRPFRLAHLSNVSTNLGKPFSVPSVGSKLIWAKITVEPTLAGKALSFLYKSPELWMTVTTRDGKDQRFRFVAGSAAAGFLISPIVLDNRAFEAIASGKNSALLDPQSVESMRLEESGWIGRRWAYQPRVTVEFDRLEFDASSRVP